MFETMTSAFVDEYPKQLKGEKKKMLLCAGLCFVEFLLGIPCIMNGGIYVLQIMDWYSSVFSLMILSFTECVIIAWVYGKFSPLPSASSLLGSMGSSLLHRVHHHCSALWEVLSFTKYISIAWFYGKFSPSPSASSSLGSMVSSLLHRVRHHFLVPW